MAEQHADFQGLCVETLTVAPTTVQAAEAYFRNEPAPYGCVADPEREVFEQYGVARRPLSLGQRPGLFIIDRNGVVRFAHVGRQQWNIPSMDQVLEVCRALRCCPDGASGQG